MICEDEKKISENAHKHEILIPEKALHKHKSI